MDTLDSKENMQKYTIIIVNSNDPKDVGSIVFSQAELNDFLNAAAPYNENQIVEESNDPSLVPVVTVEIETTGEFFKWNHKYYPKKTFLAMVLHATKKNILFALLNDSNKPIL